MLFLPLVVLAYYLVPRKGRNLWLLIASYFFYFCWHPTHLPVLWFVTAVAYGGGRLLASLKTHRRLCLGGLIVLSFVPLITLKYLNFLVDSCLVVLAHLGIQIAPPGFAWLLPMGISFYTLQAVGYLIDVYRGEKPEKNLLQMALFVAFFPSWYPAPSAAAKACWPSSMRPKSCSLTICATACC